MQEYTSELCNMHAMSMTMLLHNMMDTTEVSRYKWIHRYNTNNKANSANTRLQVTINSTYKEVHAKNTKYKSIQ